MLQSVTASITEIFLKKNIVQENDKEVFKYGFELMLVTFITVISIIGIAVVFKCFLEVIIFIGFFAVLRRNAGGWHASTYIKCFFMSVSTCFGSVYIAKFMTGNSLYLIILGGISFYCVFRYAPVESKNKPLNNDQKERLKFKSRVILIIEILIILVIYYFNNEFYNVFYNIGIIAVFMASVSLLPIFNLKRGNTNEEND